MESENVNDGVGEIFRAKEGRTISGQADEGYKGTKTPVRHCLWVVNRKDISKGCMPDAISSRTVAIEDGVCRKERTLDRQRRLEICEGWCTDATRGNTIERISRRWLQKE
jgi:hypothetical protein